MPDSPFFHYNSSFNAIETMQRHAAHGLLPSDGFVTNFLGVKVSPRYFPGILNGQAGTIEPVPIPANWHADIAEWAFALRTVDLSRGTFRAIELGCGWACWLNNTGAAARRAGMKIDLIGIEGDRDHVAWAIESLSDNGFSQDEFRIVHGVAAASGEHALFPVVADAGTTWGSEPVFNPTATQVALARRSGKFDVLDCYSLSKLSLGKPVDLLHIDIQGGETDFIKSNYDDMSKYVRRMLVGTHSRVIEGDIMRFLLEKGWALEMERPCIFGLVDGKPVIQVDGVQGWVNGELK